MAQPLTDAINALTTYANTVTGKTPPDTTLSDAVATLASGYGGGGDSYLLNISEMTSTTQPWNTMLFTNTLPNDGIFECKVLLASQTNLPNIISIGTDYNALGNWTTNNAIHFFLKSTRDKIVCRMAGTTYENSEVPTIDISVPHIIKVDKNYIYIDDTQVIAPHANILNSSVLMIGARQGNNRYTGEYNYIKYK